MAAVWSVSPDSLQAGRPGGELRRYHGIGVAAPGRTGSRCWMTNVPAEDVAEPLALR